MLLYQSFCFPFLGHACVLPTRHPLRQGVYMPLGFRAQKCRLCIFTTMHVLLVGPVACFTYCMALGYAPPS